MRLDPVLFTDAKGPYRLSDLVAVAKTWSDDPKQQQRLVESYLRGYLQGRHEST